MAELAGAATLLAGVARMAPKLLEYLEKNHKLRASLKNSIRYIEEECAMISALVQEYTDRHQKTGKGTHKVWISMVRELACEIDDAIDRFTHQIGVTPEPDAPWIRRAVHRDTTRNARNKFAAEILRLKEKSKQVYQLKEMYSDTSELDLAAPEAETWEYTASPVGMDAAHDELIELIRRAPHGQPDELKVISLVGFGGIGKTQLAKHAYNTIDTREYPVRVWVPAAKKGAQDVLKNILQQLGMYSTINTTGASSGGASSTSDDLRAAITRCLRTRRFFIVIDDISASIWNQISKAFDVVPQVGNRVIVTTTTQSIAKACSRYAGYVYVMRTLAKTESRELFCKEASLEYPPPGGAMHLCSASEEALTKCDGLPLALVTTAQFLQNKCNNEESWKFECGNLGPSLETDPLLASMKRVLVHGYTRLGSQDVKICLLYMGIYPNGHPIRRASLIRRWLAEGFITKGALAAASNNFDELINHSIIQPIDASSSNSAEVKTCQTHGMMLEFILNNTDNFVTLLDDKATRTSNVRWLSLNNRTDASSKLNSKDLCLVRSLTIFGKAHKSVLDFSKYELMRVLDLEECKHLKNKHLKEICSNLFLLRYPSLRGVASVTLLPKEIKKLQLLETLDLRETNIDILHARVIELPCLIRLFGKFKFQPGVGGRRMHKLQNWLLENSKLEMVAGFVVDKNQELTQLMNHMNLLTKLKIWCESTAEASSNLSHFSEAIKGFIQRGKIINSNIQIETGRQIETDTDSTTDSVTSFSLSLNFSGERSQDLLNFPLENGNYCLNSLKLQGNNIFSLPPFVTMLAGLTKLCLSFPHHQLSGDILAALSSIRGLKCLKLITIQLDNLVIGYDKLQSLKHLYVMVEVMNELEIQEGALPLLESLQLLCKELNGFSSTMIQSLPRLKEVTIHDGVSEETKQEWKGAAKNHSERPKLLFVKTKLMGSQLAEKISHEAATATGMTDEDVHVECEPAENSQSPAASLTAEVVTSEMVDNQMGSEPSAEISTVATAKDKTDEEDDVEGEHAEPPTDITLLMAMPPDAISTTMEVQLNGVNDETKHEWQEAAKNHPSCPNLMIVQTKPIGNVAAAEIIPAAVATGTTVEEVYVEGEPAAETSLVATASDMTDGEVHVESESADDSQNPAAQLTVQLATLMVDDQMETGSKTTAEIQAALGSTDNMMLSVNHDAVTSGQQEYSAQVATC